MMFGLHQSVWCRYPFPTRPTFYGFVNTPRQQGSRGQHGVHLEPTGPTQVGPMLAPLTFLSGLQSARNMLYSYFDLIIKEMRVITTLRMVAPH